MLFRKTFLLLPFFQVISPHQNDEKLKKMSKCAKNFLKSKETRRQDAEKELSGSDDYIDIHKIVNELGNGMTPCIHSDQTHTVNKNCKNLKFKDFHGSPSFLIDFNNGRLGNQMSSFASTYAWSRLLNIKQMVTYTTFTILNKYFKLSEADILEAEYCDPCNDLEFTPLTQNYEQNGQALYLPAYPNRVDLYAQYLKRLKEIFTFHQKYQKKAEEFLHKVKILSNHGTPVFVGVHNRRGDYNFAIKSFGGKLVGPKYFDLAMRVFKENVKDAVFVVVTDDIEWAKENIVGEDIFYSGEDDHEDGVGIDLAIMANCNHTIMTYGTFGMWGAFLAEGKVVAVDNATKVELDALKHLKSNNFNDSWLFIDENTNIEDYSTRIREVFSNK